MTKDEALKTALEALEACIDYIAPHSVQGEKDADLADKAIKTIEEALTQPAQEPVSSITKEARGTLILHSGWDDLPNGTKFYTTPQQQEPRNFCPRCGKRTADLTVIHTCTPPEGGHQ